MRTNVYVDGFNLYYGCLKGTPYKWLNVAELARRLLPNHTIGRTRYFTAKVTSRPSDPQEPMRQQVYLRALETIPGLSIHYGHYLSHPVRMPLASPPASGSRTVEVIKTEEKGSDVNLASFLLLDAFRDEHDVAAIISGDSDLCLPITLVRTEFGRKVGVLFSARRRSHALQSAADFYRPIREGVLKVSQFPPSIQDQHGQITKPARW